MAGDTANTNVWLDADVYAGDPASITAPTDVTTALDVDFDLVGILSTDGLTLGRSQDSTDFSAWGVGIFRSAKRNHKRTFVVTALEDNPVVFDLVNPGSTQATVAGVTTRTVTTPGANIKSWVFQLVDGDVTRRLYVPSGEVDEVADIQIGEDNLEAKQLTIVAYFDSGIGGFYKDLTNAAGAAVA